MELKEFQKAQEAIAPYIKRTPLFKSEPLSKEAGASIYLKDETKQKTGAFKVRGAACKLLSLSPEQRRKGVIAVSTGNHGRAVATIAAELGIDCQVFLSKGVPENKRQAIKICGAELKIVGSSYDEAFDAALKLSQDCGKVLIPPYDDSFIIQGQGSIGLEILSELSEVDTVVVPLSGGGLISGIACVMKELQPEVKVIGVSMEKGAAMYESLKAGHPIEVKEEETLADSLRGGIGLKNRYTFEMVQKYVDEICLLTEEEILSGLKWLYQKEGMLVEGAAAVGVGALLSGKPKLRGENCVLVVSGKNVDKNAAKLVKGN